MKQDFLNGVSVIYQSAVRMAADQVIYFDPFSIKEEVNDADIIFITHNHYDHFSADDIAKVRKSGTKIVVPAKLEKETADLGFTADDILVVEPEQSYEIAGIKFETVPSYNIGKKFHPKESGWVGYIVTLQDARYYVPGDMDAIEESKTVQCDVAFIPIGGTYTMDPKEAAELVNIMKPPVVVPIHYGCIVGEKEDEEVFKKQLSSDIECVFLLHR